VPVTRTNTKRWIGLCDLCGWNTNVEAMAVYAELKLAHHMKYEHNRALTIRTPHRKGQPMAVKQADNELPDQEGLVKLSDYAGQLVVFDQGKAAQDSSSYGTSDTVHADLWTYNPDHDQADKNGWVAVGTVIVWFKTVQKQIMEALPDQLGGILVKGTDRNVNEWAVTPVPRGAKALATALTTWDPSF